MGGVNVQYKILKSMEASQEESNNLISGNPVEHRGDSIEERGIYIDGKRAPSIEEEPGAYGANN